jgi:hypothetical protein
MNFTQLNSQRALHRKEEILPEEETLRGMVNAAVLNPKFKDVALAVMCLKDEEQKRDALNSFAPESEPHSFQKLLNLSALFVASGYYRSAYQTLEVAAALEASSLTGHVAEQLTTLAKRMMRGTKALNAVNLHDAIHVLFQTKWPNSLPQQENTPLLELPHGKIVNTLRSNQTKETLNEAKESSKLVIDELLENKVFPWVIDFIDLSLKHGQGTNTHGILSKDLYQQTVEKLTCNLRDNEMLSACLWHLEHVTKLYDQHLSSVGNA